MTHMLYISLNSKFGSLLVTTDVLIKVLDVTWTKNAAGPLILAKY